MRKHGCIRFVAYLIYCIFSELKKLILTNLLHVRSVIWGKSFKMNFPDFFYLNLSNHLPMLYYKSLTSVYLPGDIADLSFVRQLYARGCPFQKCNIINYFLTFYVQLCPFILLFSPFF